MTDWDSRFIELAKLIATWSRDPSSKVGSVIVDVDRRIVSSGYNGFPKGVDDSPEVYANRERKLKRVVHSEKNAILFARRDLTGCTLYCTHPPCAQCMSFIIQSGICRVVFPKPTVEFLSRWQLDYDEALLMAGEAGVEVCEVVAANRAVSDYELPIGKILMLFGEHGCTMDEVEPVSLSQALRNEVYIDPSTQKLWSPGVTKWQGEERLVTKLDGTQTNCLIATWNYAPDDAQLELFGTLCSPNQT